MKLSATRKLIDNINVNKLLVVTVLLYLIIVFGQNTKLMENEIEFPSAEDKTSNGTCVMRQSYTPRVVVVVVQTHATEGWCRLMLSAILNKIEIVTIALGALYSHEKRPGWIMEYIENEMLNDEDIIISVDGSDTIVTEREKFDRSVKYFADKSAPNESTFESDDIIKGRQISPMIFLADPHCYAPQLDIVIDSAHKEHVSRCHWFYKYAHDFSAKHSLMSLVRTSVSSHNFLSAGAFISRVWTFKKAYAAYRNVLVTGNKWWCDQSIWVLVFIWSVTQTNINSYVRALPTGMIALDYESLFFHYPLHSTSQAAAFLHFAGDPIAWKRDATVIISKLSWSYNLLQTTKQTFFSRKVSETFLEFLIFNKQKQYGRFSTICGDDVFGNVKKVFLAEK